jgi:hypothetical protein
MTYPGLGGQQSPPQNAAPAGQLVPGVQPGVSSQIIASRVIIIGTGGELLVYSPTAASGNLIASIAGAATTDSFGDNVLQGNASYGATFAAALNAGFVQFYTGSLAGGWTVSATIETDVFGDIFLLAKSGRSVTTTDNTLDDGSGNMVVSGTLSVGGSTDTGAPVGTGFFNTQGLASGSYGSTHQHTLPNFPTATHVHPL